MEPRFRYFSRVNSLGFRCGKHQATLLLEEVLREPDIAERHKGCGAGFWKEHCMPGAQDVSDVQAGTRSGK